MAARLTPAQTRFVDEYLVDLNATAAYKRAGYKAIGNAAETNAARLLRDPRVRALIEERIAARQERTEIDQDRVLTELWQIATADTNEIVQHRRHCCRYCWGEGNRYQHTRGEWDRIVAQHQADEHKARMANKPLPPEPDPAGGVGYNKQRPPNPVCEECFGDGVGEVFIADTRTLSPGARSLYAGVKETKEGLSILTHSKDKSLELLGRHQGLFKEVHEHKGVVGVMELAKAVPEDQAERIAKEMLRGRGYEFDDE